MHAEFIRYKLLRFKVLTAILEILGALGLIAGIYIPWILMISSGGLSLLMLFAFIIRIKLRDAFYLILPSLFYLLLNLYILLRAFQLDH